MPGKLEKIKDEDLRTRLQSVNDQMRKNQPTDAVKALSEVFIDMVTSHPEMMQATTPGRRGGTMGLLMRWPNLGANMSRESVMAGEPKITFVREKFAMSEAITYYEFTVDTAIAQGL